MKYALLLLSATAFLGFSSCNNDDDDEMVVIFEEPFDDADPWTIVGMEDPSVIEPGEADAEINGVLYMYAEGCTQVTAERSLDGTDLATYDGKDLLVKVSLTGFTATPIISSANFYRIAFNDFDLNIVPTKTFGSVELEFEYINGSLTLITEDAPVDYSFDDNNTENIIETRLRAESVGDCAATARTTIDAIEVFEL